jgi:N-acyl homoserine lactone hydrolase
MLATDDGLWLIDCGLATAAAPQPARFYGPVGARARLDPSETLDELLAEAGVDRAELAGVVLTHLHYDHAGALVDLPRGTPVWVHADEFQAAHQAGARLGYHPSVLAAPVAWRLFRGEESPSAGVHLIETPGHTPGHISALVAVGDRRLLVTGDAAPTRRNLREGLPPGLAVDRPAAARSLQRLVGAWQTGAIPLPSHDPAFWSEQSERFVRFEAPLQPL